jgi:hypothetical protein
MISNSLIREAILSAAKVEVNKQWMWYYLLLWACDDDVW